MCVSVCVCMSVCGVAFWNMFVLAHIIIYTPSRKLPKSQHICPPVERSKVIVLMP